MNFNTATFEAAYGTFSQLPPSDFPEIVFSGRSNVGKSSLLNKIFSRKALARVSSVPGKTITINFYRVGDVRFADLPGYGYAKVPMKEKLRWSSMMEGYFSSNRDIRLVVQLVDMRHPPTADDISMLHYLKELNFPFIVVLTKSDKLKKMERIKRMEALKEELAFIDGATIIPFSSENGEGVEEVRKTIEKYCK